MGIVYDGAGLFIGAMSYLDQMDVGILGDPDALDDPFELADGIASELAHLVVRAREEIASRKAASADAARAARRRRRRRAPLVEGVGGGSAIVTTRRRVLTTGCNSGLGLATVLEVARRGHDRRDGPLGREGRGRRRGGRARGLAVETRILDVTDAEACAKVAAGRARRPRQQRGLHDLRGDRRRRRRRGPDSSSRPSSSPRRASRASASPRCGGAAGAASSRSRRSRRGSAFR